MNLNSDLLKRLMKKFGKGPAAATDDVGGAFANRARANAKTFGGDEGMAGSGAFRPGESSTSPFSAKMGPGAGTGGPLGDPITMRPLNEWELLKRKLSQLSPEQRAAIMGAGGGLAAGGLGGYMAGDE
jgi:hypothetical protein